MLMPKDLPPCLLKSYTATTFQSQRRLEHSQIFVFAKTKLSLLSTKDTKKEQNRVSEERATYTIDLQGHDPAMSSTCAATTKSGKPCLAKPNNSGYCALHDPRKAAEREQKKQEHEAAFLAIQEM
jgi:hypothetical protein